MWSLFRRKSPLPFSFYRQQLFLCRTKKKGLNIAPTEAFRSTDMTRGAADAALQTAPRLRRIRNMPPEASRAFGAYETLRRDPRQKFCPEQ